MRRALRSPWTITSLPGMFGRHDILRRSGRRQERQAEKSWQVSSGSWLCENAKALDRDRRSYSSKAALVVHRASGFNLEIELKNFILRRVSIFEFLHSQGHSQISRVCLPSPLCRRQTSNLSISRSASHYSLAACSNNSPAVKRSWSIKREHLPKLVELGLVEIDNDTPHLTMAGEPVFGTSPSGFLKRFQLVTFRTSER
jgi:hypothetical protein